MAGVLWLPIGLDRRCSMTPSPTPPAPQRWLTSPKKIRWRWSLLNSLCFTVFASLFLLLETWISMGGLIQTDSLWLATLLAPGTLMGICLSPIQGLFLKKLMPALKLGIWMGFCVLASFLGSLIFVLAYFSFYLLNYLNLDTVWQRFPPLAILFQIGVPTLYVALFGLTIGFTWGLAQFWAFRWSGYEVKGWVWASVWGRMAAWLIAAGQLSIILLIYGLSANFLTAIAQTSQVLAIIVAVLLILLFGVVLNPWGLGGLAFGWMTGRLLQDYSRPDNSHPDPSDPPTESQP
ncbi:MAG: hypothetical protein ACO34J_08040 [Prochlorothrix sp.]